MRKIIYFMFIFLISLTVNGFAVRGENPNKTEIEYFKEKEYKGDKEIYTEVDLYPPYFTEVEVNKEDICRYLRLLRNEIFARHGYVFGSEDLIEFFGEMDWYDLESTYVVINNTERKNVSIISELENFIKQKEEETTSKEKRGLISEFTVGKLGYGSDDLGYRMWEGEPDYPVSIVTDSKDRIYILDHLNNRIRVYKEDGTHIKDVDVHVYEEASLEEMEKEMGGLAFPRLYGKEMFIRNGIIYIPVRKGFSPVGELIKVVKVYIDMNWKIEEVGGEEYKADFFNKKIREIVDRKIKLSSEETLEIVDKKKGSKKIITLPQRMEVLYTDREDNIYATNHWYDLYEYPQEYSLVLKYSKEGEKIKELKIPFSIGNPFITINGDIFAIHRIPKRKDHPYKISPDEKILIKLWR